ncbi:hypothetical protein KAR91_34265, partial [Candidatus Pacearchaeota archaeon]|nr:hypothetical protein [Candidatus Pacearchaeota archaeon]
ARADANTTQETIWNGTGDYTFPSSGAVLDVVSDSSEDRAGGTGARSIRINGLDENFLSTGETITMDGANTVTTSTEFSRISYTLVTTAGSIGSAVGNISFTHTGDTINVANINDGIGRTYQAVYTVPADKIGLLTRIDASVPLGKSVTIEMYLRDWDVASTSYEVFAVRHVLDIYQDSYHIEFDYPLPLAPRTDLDFKAVAGEPATPVSLSFDIILIDTPNGDSSFDMRSF